MIHAVAGILANNKVCFAQDYVLLKDHQQIILNSRRIIIADFYFGKISVNNHQH